MQFSLLVARRIASGEPGGYEICTSECPFAAELPESKARSC